MKDLKILFILPFILLLCLKIEKQKQIINRGDIAFVNFNSKENDSFSIIALIELKPNTKIHFTDSEWNGNRFGKDENNLIWESGNKVIPFGTIIHFKNLRKSVKSSHGLAFGRMKLNKKGDAVYAFTGEGIKNPVNFIAAISNDPKEFGTLLNTNLKIGKTAIVLPKGTYRAKYIGNLNISKKEILLELNDIRNYELSQLIDNNLANN